MVKVFKCWRSQPNPLFRIYAVETPDTLVLVLEADLLEWLVKILVSIPDKFKTVIIYLDTVDVVPHDEDQWNLREVVALFYATPLFFLNTNQYVCKHRYFYLSEMG